MEAPRFQSRIKKGEIDERASYFSLSTKNLLFFANCKKPIKKARKNYNRRESFSSFLIIGDHKKIWSRAKAIFVAPSLPPPFPPFPPQSSVFLLVGVKWRGSKIILELYPDSVFRYEPSGIFSIPYQYRRKTRLVFSVF